MMHGNGAAQYYPLSFRSTATYRSSLPRAISAETSGVVARYAQERTVFHTWCAEYRRVEITEGIPRGAF